MYASSVGYNFVFDMPLTRHSWRGMLNLPSCRHAFIGLVERFAFIEDFGLKYAEDSNAKLESYTLYVIPVFQDSAYA